MDACCIFTRRPLNVITLDIQHGRWQFAAEYTDVVWNGGWFTITHYATPTPNSLNRNQIGVLQ